jgi:hypothetical protein
LGNQFEIFVLFKRRRKNTHTLKLDCQLRVWYTVAQSLNQQQRKQRKHTQTNPACAEA